MKKFLLAVAFTSVLASGAVAQTYVPPRDAPFGKGMGNDTWQDPGAGTVGQSYRSSNLNVSPRDPPFGKGNPGNDTFNLPNSAESWRGR